MSSQPRRWAVPFGRYAGGSEGSPDTNRTLVGREGQRVAFSDLLLNHGPTGAFLVTGQRGAGKTSFVKECLRQYDNDVHARVLRSNVGRAVYWDRILFLAVGALAIVILMMAHEILATLVEKLTMSHGVHLLLAILPLVAVCGAPIIYALRLLGLVIESFQATPTTPTTPTSSSNNAGIWAFAITGGFCLFALMLTWGPLESNNFPWTVPGIFELFSSSLEAPKPEIIMSRVFVLVMTFIVFVQHFSVRSVHEERESGAGQAFDEGILSNKLKYAVSIITAGSLTPWLADWIAKAGGVEGPRDPMLYWINLGIGFALMTSFLMLNSSRESESGKQPPRVWHSIGAAVCFVASLLSLWCAAGAAGIDNLSWRAFAMAAMSAAPAAIAEVHIRVIKFKNCGKLAGLVLVFFATVLLLGLLLGVLGVDIDLGLSILIVIVARCVVLDIVFSKRTQHVNRNDQFRFVPRPLLILGIKVVAACMLGVHLTIPILVGAASGLIGTTFHPPPMPPLNAEWFLAAFLVTLALARVEYQWIVAPFAWIRDDRSRDLSRWIETNGRAKAHADEANGYLRQQRHHLRYVRYTFHWLFYSNWHQTIVVQVNLGFDKLDHGQVVQAMLAGLRETYQRRFVSPLGPVAVVSTTIKILVVVVVATLISEGLFNVNVEGRKIQDIEEIERIENGKTPSQLPSGSALRLLDDYPKIVEWLYFPIIGGATSSKADDAIKDEGLVLCMVLPCIAEEGAVGGTATGGTVTIRIYHLAIFITLFGLSSLVIRKLEITPYRPLLSQIDDVQRKLSGKTGMVVHSGTVSMQGGLGQLALPHEVQSLEVSQADPRAIENAFMRILGEIRHPRLAFFPSRRLHLPAPEVTFIFDELDKIGMRAEDAGKGDSAGVDDWLVQDDERRRSLKVHQLFAEMKNLLSSAPARFIMVGGRNLHDEWLADQTKRTPLLTNIFKGCIYLPSLLVDEPNPTDARWSGRVEEYVKVQHQRAVKKFESLNTDRERPGFGLAERPKFPLSFVQPTRRVSKGIAYPKSPDPTNLDPRGWKFVECDSGKDVVEDWQRGLREDYMFFLTFRSMGNPKKLKELLESFIRPTGRYVPDREQRWGDAFGTSEHVLLFGDDELFRVQLVSAVYRQLRDAFEKRYAQRDDKLVTALFYFSDFLFKFHRRAFTWTNIERVDELVHVHRAPDHRELLETIVVEWSERLLHPILNGLYAYRFRSDMACEIAYISRRSKEEMAAFNFTLDESQALKEMYRGYLNGMKPRPTYDVILGLGELYEFDQEFDVARHYYERAITEGDAILADFREGEMSGVGAVLACGPLALDFLRKNMVWGTNRLRVMLQIGLTFEISRNLERASVTYRDARSLGRAMLRAYLDDIGRSNDQLWDRQRWDKVASSSKERRTHSLKHLNILYQAIFAEAWAAEKMSEAVDTSVTLVERELFGLRNMLPFVRKAKPESEESIETDQISPVKTGHSNFSLSIAELHSKAGDLYFFKGRQHFEATEVLAPALADRGAEGYLLCATFHYAMCAHDLRRYITYRYRSSKMRLNIYHGDRGKSSTLQSKGWSDFMFRAVGGAVGDLADTGLAQVSFFRLVDCLKRPNIAKKCPLSADVTVKVLVEALSGALVGWLEGEDQPKAWKTLNEKLKTLMGVKLGSMKQWLGAISPKVAPRVPKRPSVETPKAWGSDGIWLKFEPPGSDLARMVLSLLMASSAAKMLESGGYREDAARELLQVAETVHHWLSWATGVADLKLSDAPKGWEAVAAKAALNSSVGCAFWCFMVDLSLYALEGARTLIGRSSSDANLGDRVPVEMLYTACSLGMVASDRRWSPDRVKLLRLVLNSLGAESLDGKIDADHFQTPGYRVKKLRRIVAQTLVRYRYPALARLRGLKLLLDEAAVYSLRPKTTAAPSQQLCCVSNAVQRIPQSIEDIRKWADEMVALEEQVQAPLHFTPLHMGVTLAQVYLYLCKQDKKTKEDDVYARHALRHLDASLELTSMRRAYYEAISGLYYLYDDYNDSQIHYNHAIQMAGYEYVCLLKEMIEDKLSKVRHASVIADVHTIERERVEMDIQA